MMGKNDQRVDAQVDIPENKKILKQKSMNQNVSTVSPCKYSIPIMQFF